MSYGAPAGVGIARESEKRAASSVPNSGLKLFWSSAGKQARAGKALSNGTLLCKRAQLSQSVI